MVAILKDRGWGYGEGAPLKEQQCHRAGREWVGLASWLPSWVSQEGLINAAHMRTVLPTSKQNCLSFPCGAG